MIILWVAINEFEVKAILINVIKFRRVCVCARRITKAQAVVVLYERVFVLYIHYRFECSMCAGNRFASTKVRF